jgi:thiamine-phosphate pyrophosphorylase
MTLASVARRLNLRARTLPALVLVTDETRLPDPGAAVAALPRASAVVFRHYGDPGRKSLARRLARLCRRRGLLFLVAADAALAQTLGARGLHVSEQAARGPAYLRRRWRRGLTVTASAHGRAGVIRAARLGADAVLLGPVFATASHPGREPLGPVRFGLIARASPLPVYALGGMTETTARRLTGLGAAGVAALGALARRL